MIETFPSIIHPNKYKFILDSDMHNDTNRINSKFAYVPANMDISLEWSRPITPSLIGEYLISLAPAILSNKSLARMASAEIYEPRKDTIEFFQSIKYSSRRKYYSLPSRKISTNISKCCTNSQWNPVFHFMDGSPAGVLYILESIQDKRIGIKSYGIYNAVRNWFSENKKLSRKYTMDLPAIHLKWTEDYDEASAIDAGWKAVMHALSICETKIDLENCLQAYKNSNMLVTLKK